MNVMEVQAEVHTVHPSSPPRAPNIKPGGPRIYGSWCTPETTPTHSTLTETRSNIETNKPAKRDINSKNKKSSILRLQKGRFGSSRLISKSLSSVEPEAITELNVFKTSIPKIESITTSRTLSKEEIFSPKEPAKPAPAPAQPSATITKWKCLNNLPAFCNPFVTIDPHGHGYICWLFLVTFCYSYNSWCVMLRATFPYQTPKNTPLWMIGDYLCDLVYLLDVALVKPRLQYVIEGFRVDDPKETRKNYRKKSQYKFDVISLLPLDILYLYFGTHMVILRFPRLLKLQTFWEFHQAMDRVLASPYVVRIGKTLYYIFYLIHLNACSYYATSAYIGLGSNSWVYDNVGNAYIRCFYFATKTATSIGKNPKPEQTVEYVYMTGAWLMGVFVFALLIGQIRDIYTISNKSKTEYKKALDICTSNLRRLNLPVNLQRRVTAWFNHSWNQNRNFNESKILNSLPFNMKRDVLLEVHIKTLSKVQLFRDCSRSLLRDLVVQLRPVCYLPGDLVVRCGDAGHDMYIINSGECYVVSQDETEVLATLKEGSVFGEICLLGIDGLRRRTATVRSRGYSNLFALSRHDLEAALEHHKEAANILRLRADQIIKENAARQAAQRCLERQARKCASASDDARARRQSCASNNADALARRLSSASSAAEAWAQELSHTSIIGDVPSRRLSLAVSTADAQSRRLSLAVSAVAAKSQQLSLAFSAAEAWAQDISIASISGDVPVRRVSLATSTADAWPRRRSIAASVSEASGRRLSSASCAAAARDESGSGLTLSKRRMSAFNERMPPSHACGCSRSPVPTIVLSGE